MIGVQADGSGVGVGSRIDGKYEVLAQIGVGGMSTVWLARDDRLGKLWAIKETRSRGIGKRGLNNRNAVIAEANFMKRLDHPAIPRVVDILERGDYVYVVMDYVDGRSLNEALRENGGPFDQERVVAWGVQLCDVLAYLHSLDPPVVYRDLKPANVMVREDGSVRLIDFGIATELGGVQAVELAGSRGYSAPEQVDAAAREAYGLDARADVYALGTTLYSLVTGETPRRVESPSGAEDYAFDLRPIRELDPTLSDGLERVLAKAVQACPDDRYASIADMRYDLEHYQELTWEHRVSLLRKVNAFRRRLRSAVFAFAVGVVLVVAGIATGDYAYKSLLHQASVASRDETGVIAGDASRGIERTAGPSEAEELYERAIAADPSRMDAYQSLVDVFKSDEVFTSTEAQRWLQVWQMHGRKLEGDHAYARLCYDVGILFLCYYDYVGSGVLTSSGVGVSPGQSAVENASRSLEWFRRARDACNPTGGDYAGLVVDDALDEYAATEVCEIIGEFYTTIVTTSREGRDPTDAYREFWNALGTCVGLGATPSGGEPAVAQSEPIVRLRLYQVAFESVNSPTYLEGFRRAGVSRDEVTDLLQRLEDETEGLSDFAETNPSAADGIYNEIVQGHDAALRNIERTYAGPVVRMEAGGEVGP